jgi:hypothetical protein
MSQFQFKFCMFLTSLLTKMVYLIINLTLMESLKVLFRAPHFENLALDHNKIIIPLMLIVLLVLRTYKRSI